MQRKIPTSSAAAAQIGIKPGGGGPLSFMSEQQDPLHTIKTEFDLQPANGVVDGIHHQHVRNPVNFSQAGIHSAQHMSRKKRINHQGIGGGYLSEAVVDGGPSMVTAPGNKTLATTYGLQ